MKHIKLFEEISTPVNPELLGVMNNPETLTRKAFSILADKYARNKDERSFTHLASLAAKYHPEWLKDSDWVTSIGDLVDKYKLDWDNDNTNPEWLGTPEEWKKMEREYEKSKRNLEKYESYENFKKEAIKSVEDLMGKYLFSYNDKKYMRDELSSTIDGLVKEKISQAGPEYY